MFSMLEKSPAGESCIPRSRYGWRQLFLGCHGRHGCSNIAISPMESSTWIASGTRVDCVSTFASIANQVGVGFRACIHCSFAFCLGPRLSVVQRNKQSKIGDLPDSCDLCDDYLGAPETGPAAGSYWCVPNDPRVLLEKSTAGISVAARNQSCALTVNNTRENQPSTATSQPCPASRELGTAQ